MLPELLAGRLVQHEQPFPAPVALQAFEVGREHAAGGDCRAAVARADRHPPDEPKAVFGKALEDAGLVPDAAAFDAPPLRPVVGVGRV